MRNTRRIHTRAVGSSEGLQQRFPGGALCSVAHSRFPLNILNSLASQEVGQVTPALRFGPGLDVTGDDLCPVEQAPPFRS